MYFILNMQSWFVYFNSKIYYLFISQILFSYYLSQLLCFPTQGNIKN